MSRSSRLLRCGAALASLVTMFGLTTSIGVASASPKGVDSVYKCYVDPNWLCAEALRDVFQRAQPTTKARDTGFVHKGGSVQLRCWTTSEPVDGNNVWYFAPTDTVYPYQSFGWIPGQFLSTDRDPAWGIGHC